MAAMTRTRAASKFFRHDKLLHNLLFPPSLSAKSCFSNTANIKPQKIKTPVCIVGGGPTGLLLSILLSQYNIPSTLIERRTPTQIHSHPQAHYINIRSMEILKHYVPNVYQNVLKDMPPVKHWNHFTFCHSVLGTQIARVRHPVTGIQIGQGGNGTLVNDFDEVDVEMNVVSSNRCSAVDPAHLAQNKFASLLLDEAMRMQKVFEKTSDKNGTYENVNLFHNESILSLQEIGQKDSDSNAVRIMTSQNREIEAEFVIGADGYHSFVRNHFQNQSGFSQSSLLVGNTEMQNLINVHFRTSKGLSKKLMERKETIGMLHFVFHQDVVGAFVCHNLEQGEWVLQVPFFPPFQTANDFTQEKVRKMVLSGLCGFESLTNRNEVDILSIKPWTMASAVAKKFLLGKENRIILAGDAAHAFPPAGGFGMNTGLQDAHNLAWRLATIIHENTQKDNMLRSYEIERRSISFQNAALSVRNYQRSLDVAKACFLNADHPSLLVKVMNSPPLSFVPMSIRQQTFSAAVKTAMLPLTNLAKASNPSNIYQRRIFENVRHILKSGKGLPLLFPRFEIGFSYNHNVNLDDQDDTGGYHPKLKEGGRMPHIELEMVSSNMEKCSNIKCKIATTTDLESQLSNRWNNPGPPKYLSILFHTHKSQEMTSFMLKMIQEFIPSGCNHHTVEVYSDENDAHSRKNELGADESEMSLFSERNGSLSELLCQQSNGNLEKFHVILFRPDGHLEKLLHFR